MIVCPNCNHPNPEGAQACEDCYTPLPATTSCPNCGAPIQADAGFCGQCGSNLHQNTASPAQATMASVSSPSSLEPTPLPPTALSMPSEPVIETSSTPPPAQSPQPEAFGTSKTQLQQQTAGLLHVQTDKLIELPPNLSVVHLGKPNDRVPPDIDVAGFPHSEVVSRIHADIRLEGDAYYLEDVGSSNGTYVNNMPLLPGNRHRLRPGDRISLGKGDLVTFLFQLS